MIPTTHLLFSCNLTFPSSDDEPPTTNFYDAIKLGGMEHSEAVCVLQQLLMSCPEFQSLSLASSSQWSSLVLQRKMSDFIFSVLPRYDLSALRLSTGVSLSPGPLMINHPNIHIRIVNPEQDVAGP